MLRPPDIRPTFRPTGVYDSGGLRAISMDYTGLVSWWSYVRRSCVIFVKVQSSLTVQSKSVGTRS